MRAFKLSNYKYRKFCLTRRPLTREIIRLKVGFSLNLTDASRNTFLKHI